MFPSRQSEPSSVSLLWLDPQAALPRSSVAVGQNDDLRIKGIANSIAPHSDYQRPIRQILATLLTDSATLAYRHEMMDDCLAQPEFTEGLRRLLPMIRGLHVYVSDIRARRNEVSLVLSRLTELESYIECVQALEHLLAQFQPQLRAAGWRKLGQHLRGTVQHPQFQQMAEELPSLRASVREIVSVTIGVNLSSDLKPIAATLLSLNKRRFKGPRFFRKLWGSDAEADIRGLTRLREAPDGRGYRGGSVMAERRETLDRLAANALFRDLGKVLDDVIYPISRALQNYTRVNSGFLRAIEPEIAFYVGAVKLIESLRARGLPMCKPRLLDLAARQLEASQLYNLDLALRLLREHGDEALDGHIVGNDVHLNETGRIQILTGPNRGGKTTYMQSIGLLHILAQSGMYVPAETAALSPVDGIYLHFPVEENPAMESGRLGEEAQRLRDIFSRATRHSLILLNETLASTSAAEGYFLARDVLGCLRMLGARAVFVTHLHELAQDCEEINREVPGESRVQSVISTVEAGEQGIVRTYRVVPAPPRGQSYAREIARQYGIGFEQLQALLNQRSLLRRER